MISKRPKRAARKQRLTELSARRARPQAQPFLLWDAKQSHLALRVRPSGSRTWVTIYSRHGRPRWLTLANANAIGLADARTMAAEAMLAVAKGKDPAAEKKADRDVGTFADLHRRYLEGHAKKRNKSWRQGETLVSRYATPRWGRLQTSTITRAHFSARSWVICFAIGDRFRTKVCFLRAHSTRSRSFSAYESKVPSSSCSDRRRPWFLSRA
jgi:hypothetical protein